MTEHAARGPRGALGIGRTRTRLVRIGAFALVGAFALAAGAPGLAVADDDDDDDDRRSSWSWWSGSDDSSSSETTDSDSESESSSTSSNWADALGGITDLMLGDVNPTNIPTTGDDFATLVIDPTEGGRRSVEDQLGLTGLPVKKNGAGILVAVLDGGFSLDHPAIAERLVSRGLDMLERDGDAHDIGNGKDDDGDGLVDDALGHGTFVAGMVLRVAPEAQILPVRVRDDEGRGSDWHLAQGIDAARKAGADVINLSVNSAEWGLPYTLTTAIRNARAEGIAVVVSAGNEGRSDLSFLAGLDGVVAACAVDSFDRLAPFSNYETEPTDARVLCAPGVDLVGPAGILTPDDYAMWSGTSFSAGLVSGCVALMLAENPRASADDVIDLLSATAAPVEMMDGGLLPNGGRIDLAAAVGR